MNLISVTQALSPFSDFSNVPPHVLEAAAERGTKIHRYIAARLMNLWVPQMEANIQPYFDSFMSWYEQTVERTIYIEKELICTCWGYIGHIDWVGVIRGDKGATIIDWKSPATEAPSWLLQISAYRHLLEVHGGLDLPVERCGALMLSPEGKLARFKEYSENSAAALNAFVACLTAYKWMVMK